MQNAIVIVEIFSSIQGEGKYVGCRQLFVRLAGCNLACAYCDTPESRKYTEIAKIEKTAGKRDFMVVPNPITVKDLSEYINGLLQQFPHHSVSFTGGEPLCQAEALANLLPRISGEIYLETNGTLFAELSQMKDLVDIISMDIKLPSATGQVLWQEHAQFLRVAADKEIFIKVVLSKDSAQEEFFKVLSLIADINAKILLILQPVTPVNGCVSVSPEEMLEYQEAALRVLKDVRVIPQTHKFIGQL